MRPSALAVAEDAVREFLAGDTAARALGMTVGAVAPGAVTTHTTIRPEVLDWHGSAPGAALFAVAGIAVAMACTSHGNPVSGRSCSIEYPAPASPGDAVTATAVERSAVGRGAITTSPSPVTRTAGCSPSSGPTADS